jgi:hypothetical protein
METGMDALLVRFDSHGVVELLSSLADVVGGDYHIGLNARCQSYLYTGPDSNYDCLPSPNTLCGSNDVCFTVDPPAPL